MADDIERTMRNFLWEGNEEWGFDHLVPWNEVCKPKKLGELGIDNILKRNKALLNGCGGFHCSKSLWAEVIKSKYGLRTNRWDTLEVSRVTCRSPWKFIAHCHEEVFKNVKLKVGKEDNIRFWEDCWVGDSKLVECFPLLYLVAHAHNASISSLRSMGDEDGRGGYSWNLRFFRRLNERELEQINDLIIVLNSVQLCFATEDRRIWK